MTLIQSFRPWAPAGTLVPMHWFWRATVSIFLPSVVIGVVFGIGGNLLDPVLLWLYSHFNAPISNGLMVSILILTAMLLGFGLFGIMTRLWPPLPNNGETCCRRCGYILRGISEPRCPECGERI